MCIGTYVILTSICVRYDNRLIYRVGVSDCPSLSGPGLAVRQDRRVKPV